jgi:hypothetical protein
LKSYITGIINFLEVNGWVTTLGPGFLGLFQYYFFFSYRYLAEKLENLCYDKNYLHQNLCQLVYHFVRASSGTGTYLFILFFLLINIRIASGTGRSTCMHKNIDDSF